MEVTEITDGFINKFFDTNYTHPLYKTYVDYANRVSFHFDGYKEGTWTAKNPYFKELIEERRPREHEHIRQYRRKIYSSKTKGTIQKANKATLKIYKSDDWVMTFKNVETGLFTKKEGPENYLNQMPNHSLKEWISSVAHNWKTKDPHAWAVVVPKNPRKQETDTFNEPEIIMFKSSEVLEFKGVLVVISPYNNKHRWFINENEIVEAKLNDNGVVVKDTIMIHNTGHIPGVMLGGDLVDMINGYPLYVTHLDPMLPDLDDAAREYSDLQAEVVQHMNSIFWTAGGKPCKDCKGTGYIKKDTGRETCSTCNGSGHLPFDPYEHFEFQKPEVGDLETPIPFPHAGYIQKDTSIVAIQDDRIQNHLNSALASINMEHIGVSNAGESGEKKIADMDTLISFYRDLAKSMVKIQQNVAEIIIKQRYKPVLQSSQGGLKIEELFPKSRIPENYDILSPDQFISQIKAAKDAGVDSTVILQLNEEYANKRFESDPDKRDLMRIRIQHDPFPTNTIEEVADMDLAGLITKESAIRHANLDAIIRILAQQNNDFFEKSYDQIEDLIQEQMQPILKKLGVNQDLSVENTDRDIIAPAGNTGQSEDE